MWDLKYLRCGLLHTLKPGAVHLHGNRGSSFGVIQWKKELLGNVVFLVRGKSTVASPVECGLWNNKIQTFIELNNVSMTLFFNWSDFYYIFHVQSTPPPPKSNTPRSHCCDRWWHSFINMHREPIWHLKKRSWTKLNYHYTTFHPLICVISTQVCAPRLDYIIQ